MPDQTITLYAWITLAAVVVAPLLAVQAQKAIEAARDVRHRRMRLFHTLMGTRASRTSPEHVQALNMIDLEFYGSRLPLIRRPSNQEKRVVTAWKIYRDHLNSHPSRSLAPGEAVDYNDPKFSTKCDLWISRGGGLFVDLLFAMSQSLNYDFDRVDLEKGIYTPEAHATDVLYQVALRNWFTGLADGTEALPVKTIESAQEQAEEKALREALTQFLVRARGIEIDRSTPPGDALG